MKKHSERLTELCLKLLNGGLEDFSQREIFEMLLLFSGRNVEFSDIEYLVGKYDSYGDLLSDKTVAIMSNGNENIALTGLIKLINETVGLCINNENSEEQKSSDFRKRTYLFCETHSDERIQKVIDRLVVMNYDTGSEVFKVAFLDSGNRILWIDDVAHGDFGDVNIDIPQLMRKALSKGVKGILVAHNHPDGDLTPSVSDNRVTDRLKKVCDDINISFVDHIIVHGGRYHSIYRQKEQYSLPARGSEMWKRLNENSRKSVKGIESAGFYSAYKIAGINTDDIPKNFDPAEENFLPYYDDSNGDFDEFDDYCSDDFGTELIDFDDD